MAPCLMLLFALLAELDAAKIHYSLERTRSDTVGVRMAVVGRRVEVDVFDDGHMEVAEFAGSEDVTGDIETVKTLIAETC